MMDADTLYHVAFHEIQKDLKKRENLILEQFWRETVYTDNPMKFYFGAEVEYFPPFSPYKNLAESVNLDEITYNKVLNIRDLLSEISAKGKHHVFKIFTGTKDLYENEIYNTYSLCIKLLNLENGFTGVSAENLDREINFCKKHFADNLKELESLKIKYTLLI